MAVVDRHAFVFAHPDDEFACSGVIAGLVKKGDDVRCVYLTDGGHGGQSIERRRKEAEAALTSLGLEPSRIHQLGMDNEFPDGALHTMMPQAKQALLRAIEVFAAEREGGLTLHLPAWEGGHQDHDTSHAIGVAVARELGADLRQFPLYCGKGLPGPLFFVHTPIAENGAVLHRVRVGLRGRMRAIGVCFRHPSQWKSWVGLLPFFVTRMLLLGRFSEQGVDTQRVRQRPHPGALLYERRGGPRYEDLAGAVANLLDG